MSAVSKDFSSCLCAHVTVANLRTCTKIPDFRVVYSSIILISRGEIPRHVGDFTDSLSHGILVGTIVGRLGVHTIMLGCMMFHLCYCITWQPCHSRCVKYLAACPPVRMPTSPHARPPTRHPTNTCPAGGTPTYTQPPLAISASFGKGDGNPH